MDPITIALFAGTFALSAAGSIYAMMQQRQAIEMQKRAADRSFDISRRGSLMQAGQRKEAIFNRTGQIRGQIRARAADAGVGTTGGTFAALMRQASVDAMENFDVIDQNAAMRIEAADAARPRFMEQNPWIQGALAIVGGAQTGLQIGTNVQQLRYLSGDPGKAPGQGVNG